MLFRSILGQLAAGLARHNKRGNYVTLAETLTYLDGGSFGSDPQPLLEAAADSTILDVLPRFCERTILLRQGRIVADGPTAEVVRLYTEGRPINEPTLADAAHGG